MTCAPRTALSRGCRDDSRHVERDPDPISHLDRAGRARCRLPCGRLSGNRWCNRCAGYCGARASLARRWRSPDALRCSTRRAATCRTSLHPRRGATGRRRRPATSLADWWQRFHDPQLTALVTQAWQANNDVRTAQAALRQSRAQRDVAAAGLLPTVNAAAAAQRGKAGDKASGQCVSGRLRCELGTGHLRRRRERRRCRGRRYRGRGRVARERPGLDRRRSGGHVHGAVRARAAACDRARQPREPGRDVADRRVASPGGTDHLARRRAGAHVDGDHAGADSGARREHRAGQKQPSPS